MQVRVFRNLTRDAWSIQTRTQGAWRTVAHAAAVSVDNGKFHASEASRLGCAAAGKREVHAWVEGTLSAVVDCTAVSKWNSSEIAATLIDAAHFSLADLPRGVTYRPFVESGFRLRDSGEIVETAARVHFAIPSGCTIS